jgi:hypothetical protein
MSQNSSLLDFLEMIDLPVFSADNGRTLRIIPLNYPKNAGTCTFDQWIRRWTRRIAGIGGIRKKMEPKLDAAPQSDHSCANEIEYRPIKNKKSRWLSANEITF